jgi:hypothetical protein
MSNARNLFIGFLTVVAALSATTATAHAQRKMLVLIDASGSMSIERADLTTRFAAAKARALSQIADQGGSGLEAVAVYTFSDTTSTLQTVGGFVDPNIAITTVQNLDLFTVGGGLTPLAGSVCDAVDTLTLEPAAEKILQIASDGEENFTPDTHLCFGLPSTDPLPPYTENSWQNKVLNKVSDANFQVVIDLFDPGPITGLAARAAASADPEGDLTAKTRLLGAVSAIAAAGEGPPTLRDFFAEIARVSGGRLTVIEDTAPQLPVLADLDGNSCVDRSDALLIARKFSQSGPPQDNPTDLDLDGTTGFADYAIALGRFTPGGCGQADPYTPRAPILCRGAQILVVNREAIEHGGITVEARGSCNIIIRDSLIVAGRNALNILGSAVITVERSIIVGEDAFLSSVGATLLFARDSVFHGARRTVGPFAFIDLGGNTFE